MMLGISLDPCFIPFGADEEVYPAPIFQMSRRVKEEAFIIFLLFLFFVWDALGKEGRSPSPLCVFEAEYSHRRKLPSWLPVPAEAAFRTNSQQKAAGAQSRPWAPCPVCAH